MNHEGLMVLLVVIAVVAHVLTWAIRPRQITDAVQAAIAPVSSQLSSMERRLAEQEARSQRSDQSAHVLESEIHRRLQDVMLHITRMEAAMMTRAEYERLHARINELGRELRASIGEIATSVVESQTQAEQAITRVQRVEQHLMENDR